MGLREVVFREISPSRETCSAEDLRGLSHSDAEEAAGAYCAHRGRGADRSDGEARRAWGVPT